MNLYDATEPMTPPHGLRLLAQWFDMHDATVGAEGKEVQEHLRQWADEWIDATSLAKMLGMADPPPTVKEIAQRACQILAEERGARVAAEIELGVQTTLTDAEES